MPFYKHKDFSTRELGKIEVFGKNLEYLDGNKFSLNILPMKIWHVQNQADYYENTED